MLTQLLDDLVRGFKPVEDMAKEVANIALDIERFQQQILHRIAGLSRFASDSLPMQLAADEQYSEAQAAQQPATAQQTPVEPPKYSFNQLFDSIDKLNGAVIPPPVPKAVVAAR